MVALRSVMNKITAPLVVMVSFTLLSSLTGAVYAGANTGISPQCGDGGTTIDLRIMDQDEPWGEGVSGTWTASGMAPGDSFDFNGSFIGLRGSSKGRISVTSSYTVTEGPPGPSDGDMDTEDTSLVPDAMTSKMLITRAVYSFSDWQIDCLTGEPTGMTPSEKRSYDYDAGGWAVQDPDGDGRISLADLRETPLAGLPLPNGGAAGARFVMSLKFADDAGNNLQGDILHLTMAYTLGPW